MKWTHIDTEWATQKEYQVISGKPRRKVIQNLCLGLREGW